MVRAACVNIFHDDSRDCGHEYQNEHLLRIESQILRANLLDAGEEVKASLAGTEAM